MALKLQKNNVGATIFIIFDALTVNSCENVLISSTMFVCH
jgi:hypothetical protein